MNIHPGGSADPAGNAPNVLRPECGPSQVSHDMELIFGAADALPDGKPSHASRRIVPIVARSADRRARRSGARRWLALPGIVIAAALGVAIGLTHGGTPNLPSPQIAKPVAPPASQAPEAHPVLTVARAPAHSAMPTSMASKLAGNVSATVGSRPWLRAASYFPRHEATRRLAPGAVTRAARPHGGESCGRLGRLALARCMRPQLVDADRQLRKAYHHAARAGVDRRVLVSYRDQWSSLRGRANSDPRRVVVRYRQMAQQLNAARSGRRARDI